MMALSLPQFFKGLLAWAIVAFCLWVGTMLTFSWLGNILVSTRHLTEVSTLNRSWEARYLLATEAVHEPEGGGAQFVNLIVSSKNGAAAYFDRYADKINNALAETGYTVMVQTPQIDPLEVNQSARYTRQLRINGSSIKLVSALNALADIQMIVNRVHVQNTPDKSGQAVIVITLVSYQQEAANEMAL